MKIAAATLTKLMQPSTATLTTVLRAHGLTNTFMRGVHPLRPGMRMAGLAFTLRYIPAHLAESAADATAERELLEGFILEKVQAGASIVGSYPPDETTLTEFQRWRVGRG